MVGMAHAIAHALGGVYKIPHGLACALALPEVMEVNLAAKTERFARVAVAMGVRFPQVVGQGQSLIRSGHAYGAGRNSAQRLPSIGDWVLDKARRAGDVAVDALDNLDFVDNWIRTPMRKGRRSSRSGP